MLKVSNRGVIRRLSLRALSGRRTRNLVAVLAIALTAMLFCSLFTIALSINEGIQQSNFRQAGSRAHGSFKYLTQAEFDALKENARIAQWGLRRFVGMPSEPPFNKAHVEISYCDETCAQWMFCEPTEGRLPREGTSEAAVDARVLELLGVEPELGAEFTLRFDVDGRETAQRFTLCGWWPTDEAIVARHVLIPESRANEILSACGVNPDAPDDGMTGSWNLDVMLKSGDRRIAQELEKILQDCGFQGSAPGENYIDAGVNWGYSGAQLSARLDPTTALAICAMLLLILLTGYLIIYNVFQISVAGDIRAYGLLKAIGVTPRQLRRIIRTQALALSAAGVPVGLLLGWLVGGRLTPVIASRLDGVADAVSLHPAIFLASALFSLLTVLISCRRPGRMAGRVSPVEALRYAEGGGVRRAPSLGRGSGRAPLFSMALSNLGRSPGKAAVTVLSLSLAVVLLSATVQLTGGFDMDKYVARSASSDFLLADARHFQTGGELFSAEMALSPEAVAEVSAQGGVADGGAVYGAGSGVLEFVPEDHYRRLHGRWYDSATLDAQVAAAERDGAGRLADGIQLYGMSAFALSKLTLVEGDLSRLLSGEGNYIAAVCSDDDYGAVEPDSHWAQLGDSVTLRYVEEYVYCDAQSGQVYGAWEDVPEGADWSLRPSRYRDVNYTVAARVVVPSALSYRYYGSDEFILSDAAFLRDAGADSILYYAFDVEEGASEAMERYLQDYTTQAHPELDYESRASCAAEFEELRSLFALLGGALSGVVALVGALNFFNATLTGIAARRRELAVLRAVGMTQRQQSAMLAMEGLIYALSAALLSLVLELVAGRAAGRAMGAMFWFFTDRPALWPALAAIPLFALMGALIPRLCGHAALKRSIVERLSAE